MKKISLKELPEFISDEAFETLVEMAYEFPKQTFDWRDISNYLSEHNYPLLRKILDKVDERKKAVEKLIEDAKSEEQKEKEKQEWQAFIKNADSKKFYGNMGEPETPQQWKDKYGTWPPGYDKDGNKI